MKRRLIAITAVCAALSSTALGQVVSVRADKVAVTVYPGEVVKYAPLSGGLVMVTERRTVDLPAGPATVRFEGVAEGIVPQTVAVQGLPDEVKEQNFDYQLLTPGSLIQQSTGRTVSLVRANPATGQVTEERARVVSGDNGAVLDIAGRTEALKCADMPERLVFDDLPAGFSARPTLSVHTVSPKAGRYVLTLSYLATGVSWKANYVARLRPDGKALDLTSWITLSNASASTLPDAPVQVIAGRLQRRPGETRPVEVEPVSFEDNCWAINSGRFQPERLLNIQAMDAMAEGAFEAPKMAMAAPAPPPAPMARAAEIVAEDLGDYKLYALPEPTTLAAYQTKQLQMFQRQNVAFERVYRARYASRFQSKSVLPTPEEAALVLEMENRKTKGLGLALPAGGIAVFEPMSSGRQRLAGEASLRDTAENLPFELELGRSANVRLTHRIVSGDAQSAEVEVLASNALGKDAVVEIREDARAVNFRIANENRPHVMKDGSAVWRFTVPANSSVTLTYAIGWKR